MSVKQNLAAEFHILAVEELRDAGIEPTLQNRHRVLKDWCEIYEDVPPRNRAESAVQDALIMARDWIADRIPLSVV